MRGYFYFWFSCGYRSLNCLCFFNNIPFNKRKVVKIELSFLEMKEYLKEKKIISYAYFSKEHIFDNSIIQTILKGQNHFIYLLKSFSSFYFVYDCSKLFVFRLVKKEKLHSCFTGYQLTLKGKIKLKKLFLKVFRNLLALIKVQIFIFILKIFLNMV